MERQHHIKQTLSQTLIPALIPLQPLDPPLCWSLDDTPLLWATHVQ